MDAISGPIQLLLYLLVCGLVIYLVYWIVGMLTLPQPVKTVIMVIIAIVVLLWLLSTFGIFTL